MGKVFTITEGVENLGALKSGGQGSVYKARKTGEIITAIKILPTPIASESEDDKHFASFQNEVQKLKKVNETSNPNVVSIIDSGITTSGNLPYIEMEYIEGPDLGDLLKPPYESVFTVKETMKVAEQLANALAHCHRSNIKHGDIKSNNIKFNQRTGNYVLLDFGLSVMSDEQRRTSIRYAGAIEFMAPEQSTGETLFETDIYSFGIILFELLTGTVPFPLMNKGEMARNAVMLAHMETLPPDIITLRRAAIESLWSYEKTEREMQIPVWFISMIYKCLEKLPGERFRDGRELLDHIHSGIIAEERKRTAIIPFNELPLANVDDSTWKAEVGKLQKLLAEKEELLNEMQYKVQAREMELYDLQYSIDARPKMISKSLFLMVLVIAIGVGCYAGYNHFYKRDTSQNIVQQTIPAVHNTDSSITSGIKNFKKPKNSKTKSNEPVANKKNVGQNRNDNTGIKSISKEDSVPETEYNIMESTYLYRYPNKYSRTDSYITKGNINLQVLNEKDDFVYVRLVKNGVAAKGWLPKNSVRQVNDY
ncbi:MAG: serine/threonine-protein kinase [Bacteroidota bacterium]